MKETAGKIISQEGGLLCFLSPFMKVGLPLMNYTLKPLAKSILIPLALMAAVLVKDTAIQEKIHGSGMTTLIISNEEMNYIIILVKYLLKNQVYWQKVLAKQLKMKQKNKNMDSVACY